MKKSLILAALLAVSAAVSAQNEAPQGPGKRHGFHGGNGCFGPQLTDEQKACVEEQGCPRPERVNGEKPDEEAMRAARKCRQKAFETCGIEMPGRPEGKGEGEAGPAQGN